MKYSERLTIVVPADDPIQIQGSIHLDRLKPYGDVILYSDRPTDFEKIDRAKNADILINTRGGVTWPGVVLRELTKLRLISVCSIGTDNIDLETASDMGIVVSNQPARTAGVVAEHIFALMFSIAKRVGFQTIQMKAGRWTRMENIYLQGKTIGIVGTGNIGSELARLSNAIGMNVIAWTFNPSEDRGETMGLKYVDLDVLLASSDVVSLNVALTNETRGMIGDREFSLMKQGALLVNCARGPLVDTTALVKALDSGRLAGAALDVYDVEPLPDNYPVLACEHVILTPHMADQTAEGIELLNEGVVNNVISFLEGSPENVVNPAVLQ